MNTEQFTSVLSACATIITVVNIAGYLAQRVGQPRVVGEMIAGILLGPSLLGSLLPGIYDYLFNNSIREVLFFLGNLGLCLYMFVAGMKLDTSFFNKKAVQDFSWIALVSLLVPILAGYGFGKYFGSQLMAPGIDPNFFALISGIALAVTALPMLVRILDEKKLLQTRLGVIAVFTASLEDIVVSILLSICFAIYLSEDQYKMIKSLLGISGIISFMFFICRPFFKRMNMRMKDRRNTHFILSFILVFFFLVLFLSERVGFTPIIASFLFGLCMPRKSELSYILSDKLSSLTPVFLLPVFFAYTGINTHFQLLFTSSTLFMLMGFVLIGFASKFISVLTLLRLRNFTFGEACKASALLNSRGVMGLFIANLALQKGIINAAFFTIIVVSSIISTMLTNPLYAWGERREKN
ncbi:MAG: cation:proton antiporter [Chitinophagaceae bacterium]|nr:cation:proton antiporter [Chitinophagaceae bacterium]